MIQHQNTENETVAILQVLQAGVCTRLQLFQEDEEEEKHVLAS